MTCSRIHYKDQIFLFEYLQYKQVQLHHCHTAFDKQIVPPKLVVWIKNCCYRQYFIKICQILFKFGLILKAILIITSSSSSHISFKVQNISNNDGKTNLIWDTLFSKISKSIHKMVPKTCIIVQLFPIQL